MSTTLIDYITESKTKFEEYINITSCPKLQIGSGKTVLAGWFNTDIEQKENVYYLDLLQKFYFPDNSFNFIFSEHNIEHFNTKEVLHILLECNRVLKPGGILRISTPDLKQLIDFYLLDNSLNNEYCKFQTDSWLPLLKNCSIYNKAFVLNDFFRNWGHKTIFDYSSLSDLLRVTGFIDINRVDISLSSYSELNAIENHDQHNFNKDFNKLETMTIEAKKCEGIDG